MADNFRQIQVMEKETWKTFIKFCSSKLFPTKEYCAEVVIVSCIIQVALILVVGYAAYQKETVIPSLGQASFLLLPEILWNVMFTVTFVYALIYTVPLVHSLPFYLRVLYILMVCTTYLCGVFEWMVKASRLVVLFNSFRMNGILFVSLGIIDVMLFSLILVMLVLFASWRCRIKVEVQGE
jgi:hypothetical protein